jgi:preprotein translocase subunit SecE
VHVSQTRDAAATPERRPSRSAQVERGNVFSRIGLWYRQIVAELRKVIWPTRKELVAYTTVTLVFAIVMIALVASLDYGANWLVLKIFG